MPDQSPRDPRPALPPRFITAHDVADRLGVSAMSIYRMIDRGELRAYRIGRSVRIDPRDVATLVRSRATVAFEIRREGEA